MGRNLPDLVIEKEKNHVELADVLLLLILLVSQIVEPHVYSPATDWEPLWL